MYEDDRWEEDRWEPSERARRAAGGPGGGDGGGGGPGRSLGSSVAVVVAAVVVGALGGYAVASSFGTDGSSSDAGSTVTEVVTATVTEEAPVEDPDAGAPGEAVSCARGPSEKRRFEPNETPGDATGPLAASEARTGRLGNDRDIDHWAICVDRPVEVTFSLECTSGECEGLFGSFPAGESFAADFDTDDALTCRIPRRGRYAVAIESRTRPVNYSLTVRSPSPLAIVTMVDSQFPDEEFGNDTC